jgi:nitrate reductase gamma subunit
MGTAILIIFYGSILFCAITSIIKIVKCASAPLHLRWELYYGSSVYESPGGWKKINLSGWRKLRRLFPDIFLLREYFRQNIKFWIFLSLFHAGLYLLILWHVWLLLAALSENGESASIAGLIWGHIATALTIIGACGILFQRVIDKELKVQYSSVHYIKWIFMLLTLLGGFYAVHIHFDFHMPTLLSYVRQQLTFQDLGSKLHPPIVPALHVLFVSIWLFYFPFSHTMNLISRYYHHLRWDDRPNLQGSRIEKKIKAQLNQPLTWSALHIQSGRTWQEAAAEMNNNSGVQRH